MTTRFRRPMLVLGTTILVMQAVFMPVGMVYAETTMDTEEQEVVELPPMKNYLEEVQVSDPRFFFDQSQMNGMVEELLKVTFFSDQEVSEVRVFLPEEATLLKVQLPTGISVVEGVLPHEWIVQSQRAQNTFVLPLVFGEAGIYELSVGETMSHLEIRENKETSEEVTVEEIESSENDPAGQEGNKKKIESEISDSMQWLIVSDTEGNIIQGSLPYGILLAPSNNQAMIMSGEFAIGSTLRLARAGYHGDELVDILLEVPGWFGTAPTGLRVQSNTNQGLYLLNSSTKSGLQYKITAVKNGTNEKIDADIIIPQNYHSYKVVSVSKEDMVGFAVTQENQNSFSIQENRRPNMISIVQTVPDSGVFFQGIEGSLIMKNGAVIEYETQDFHGSMGWFTTTGANRIKFPYPAPNIQGGIDEKLAQYTVTQTLPRQFNSDFYPESLEIEIGLDWNLFDKKSLDLSSLFFIDTQSNSSIQPSSVEKIEEGLRISLSKEQLTNSSQGQSLKLNLEIPLVKDWSILSDFYEALYWNLPATVSNNQIDDHMSGIAKVKIYLKGDPVPQVAAMGTSTNDLNFQQLVINMQSPDPDDLVSIQEIDDHRIFDSVGETEVSVILKGSHSHVETQLDVPIIVIEGSVPPLDPLDPEVEVNPENTPELPENQGLLSIDFVSSFDFGSKAISVHDQTYYAQPQRLLNEDGTVNESEERPNYVQISDRRSETDRNGWTLAVTQKEQFKGAENQVLNGASLSLSNQQVITAQGGTAPGLQSVPCTLVPGNRRTLLHAQGSEGTGTWIYRFGDIDTAGESVALDVPRGANSEATTYSSTLIWELSAVPGN